MLCTFETLPDEILMIILPYCGHVVNIFHTFLGLNQRLNQILIDRRLHLLTDFLHVNARDDYYNSRIFQQVSRQLLSINISLDEEKLNQLLQPLIIFHIQLKYIELGCEFQLYSEKFHSVRQQLTDDKIIKIDNELKEKFHSITQTPLTMQYIHDIEHLVLTVGARLICNDDELCGFNFSKFINDQFLAHIKDTDEKNSFLSINSYLKLFKILIISNPFLLNNKDYVGNGGLDVIYFLIYTLYQLNHFYHGHSSTFVNMKYYRAIVDLFLFAIQCRKQAYNEHYDIRKIMFEVLQLIPEINNDIFIQTAQREILKIIIDECNIISNQPVDEYERYDFQRILKNLVKKQRLDIIRYIDQCDAFKELFKQVNYSRECIDIMTGNRSGRQLLGQIFKEKLLNFLYFNKSFIFILLDKKERKLIKQLLELFPHLISEVDNDGNDPLLYICLKVYGCRHRIIEHLIKMGSDLERKNIQGQNFMAALQLQRNRKLLKTLYEKEIIKNDIQYVN
ncbi:unnamed protein product [Adineta steineri]|uniref:Ankyrin repeat protein n=1 Tax=Adineta steineri TaxID=433720 RepID=A0A814FPD3_9BILA|nr:unnamed protein product [Adineta steineri]CAF1190516.1 unnamed protein product [Adineta steineri]